MRNCAWEEGGGTELEALRRENAELKAELERVRSEEAEIREKLALCGDVLSSRRDWYWEVNERFMLTYCSDRVLDVMGYTPEEMIGHSPLEFIVPEDRPRIERTAGEIIPSRQPLTNLESWNFTRDGGRVCFLTSGVPFYNAKGVFQGYRGINQDITEHKQMESLMSEVRNLALALGSVRNLDEGLSLCLRTALSLSGMDGGGAYILDHSEGSLRLVVHQELSPDFIEKVSFYPADSPNTRLVMNGKPIYAHASDINPGIAKTSLPEGLRLIAVIPILHQGSVTGCFNLASNTLDEFPALLPGIVEALIAPIGNTIARLQSEQTVRESESRLRALFSAMNDVVLVIDSKGRYLEFAPSGLKLLYRPAEELRGKTLHEVFPTEQADFFLRHVQESLEKRQAITMEYRLVINQVEYWFSSTLSPFSENSVIMVARDITDRKRAEEALRESEEKYRLLFDASPVGTGIADMEGNVLTMNRSMRDLTGYTLDDYKPRVVRQTYAHPEERERMLEILREKRQVRDLEIELIHKDGPKYFALLNVDLVEMGGETVLLTTVRDITAHKHAEEALLASERRYREIFDSIPVSIWEYDLTEALRFFTDNVQVKPDELDDFFDRNPEILDKLLSSLRLLDVNRETVLMYGATDKEDVLHFVGKHMLPDIRETFRRVAADFLAGEERIRIETVHETIDGKRIDILLQVSFTEEMKRTGHALFAILNITDRKRTERALRESEERNRKILETTRDGFSLVDGSGKFVDVNEAYWEMMGYTREEMLGIHVQDLKMNDDPEVFMIRQKAIVERGFDRFEARHYHKTGKIIDVEVSVTYLPGENLFVSFVRDITERKRLEHQLIQAQKMETLGRLAGGVAHDFNNILTVINSNAEVGLTGTSPSDPHYEAFEEICKAGERAVNLTRQLLAFSRRQIAAPRVINLNNTLLDMDKMLRRLIGENIELKTIPDDSLFPVKADPGQIEQVIINLVVNARDAMPRGGKLTLETKNVFLDEEYTRTHPETVPGLHVMLAVSDTGTGMGEEELSHIFEPFFTTKPVGKGTGMGLPTCYGIVKQNRGGIWFYSEMGRGTMVKVYLPAIEDPSQAFIMERDRGASPGGTETVLVVEDDADVRKLVVRHLAASGYTVLSAANGDEALARIHKHGDPIHLLITDMIMPLMGGRELADRLAAIQPDVRILFMSGYTDSSIVHHGVLDEGVKFIQKPFSLAEFMWKIRETLEG